MSIIKGFAIGFSNSCLAIPYILGQLDCGHCCSVKLVAREGNCCKCGKHQNLSESGATICVCGSQYFTQTFSPNPHNAAHRVTAMGEYICCETCETDAAKIKWLTSLDTTDIRYARYSGHGSYYLYGKSSTSPTGVLCIGSVPSSAESLLRIRGICMVSPTER